MEATVGKQSGNKIIINGSNRKGRLRSLNFMKRSS